MGKGNLLFSISAFLGQIQFDMVFSLFRLLWFLG